MTHTGSQLIANILQRLGVEVVFGLVGIPVVDVAEELIKSGIRFISFRNEQSASYAASLYGYLTGRPAVLLVVGGPGVVHACAGIHNSQVNRWPLLVLAGSTSSSETYRGGFQELDQVTYLAPNVKFSCRPRGMSQLPFLIQKSLKISLVGVPGATYVDLPADIIQGDMEDNEFQQILQNIDDQVMKLGAPKFIADPSTISVLAETIKSASAPLIVIGKGASYSDSYSDLRKFITSHDLPFLPTPMGKGVVEDASEFNTSSARSLALRGADVVVLVGARLNWILHHGEAPRFRKDVKFIQIDISGEDIGDNGAVKSYGLGLVGDISLTLRLLDEKLGNYKAPKLSSKLLAVLSGNESKLKEREIIKSNVLLTYNQVYKIVKDKLAMFKDDLFYVIEGANTMDIARISFESHLPKRRLDAGTNATMGVGLGYAIAAKLANPNQMVLAIEGDSAFGFSAIELETIARSKLPMIIIVMNNSGVYHGMDLAMYKDPDYQWPSTALSHNVRYDIMAESLGVNGVFCLDANDVSKGLERAISNYQRGETTLLNVLIESGSGKKLEFGWQNKKKQSNGKL